MHVELAVRWRRGFERCALGLALALGSARAGSAAASLEGVGVQIAGDASGAGCASASAPAAVAAVFGPVGVVVPAGGIAPCGLAGSLNAQTDPASPLEVSDFITGHDWTSGAQENHFSSSASTLTRHGVIQVSSQGILSGGGDYHGAEAMGVFRDRWTVTSPSVSNGSNGTLLFRTTTSGALSTTGSGVANGELAYLVNGAQQLLFRAQATSHTTPPSFFSETDAISGFSLFNGSTSGSDEVASFAIPIVFGTPFDFRLALLSYSIPTESSVATSDWSARVSGIEIRGPANQVVGDFAIASDSGAHYRADGIALPTVPALPLAALAAAAAALGAGGARALRRGRARN
jgi:hypothetical protein